MLHTYDRIFSATHWSTAGYSNEGNVELKCHLNWTNSLMYNQIDHASTLSNKILNLNVRVGSIESYKFIPNAPCISSVDIQKLRFVPVYRIDVAQ